MPEKMVAAEEGEDDSRGQKSPACSFVDFSRSTSNIQRDCYFVDYCNYPIVGSARCVDTFVSMAVLFGLCAKKATI